MVELIHSVYGFQEKARLHNEKICGEIIATCEKKLIGEIENLPSPLKLSDMNTLISDLKQAALDEVCAPFVISYRNCLRELHI